MVTCSTRGSVVVSSEDLLVSLSVEAPSIFRRSIDSRRSFFLLAGLSDEVAMCLDHGDAVWIGYLRYCCELLCRCTCC